MSLIAELRRRNVLRAAAGYIVGAWLIIQVVETIFPAFGFGDVAVRWVVIALSIGFLPAMVMAWVFEWTPGGLKRDHDVDRERTDMLDRGKRFDRLVMLGLALGIAYFAVDKFLIDPARDAAREQQVAQQARSEALVESYGDRSIAVLPFVNMSSDPEQEYFADGISEELLNLLAHSPQLRVISRSSAFTFKGRNVSIPEVAEQLSVSYVLEGSVRRSADRLRITAQLIEARADTHVWSQTYDRPLGDIFAIQDDVAGRVVEALQVELLDQPGRDTDIDPQAYALLLQARQLLLLSNPEDKPRVRALLQSALEREPDYAEAYFTLGLTFWDEDRDEWRSHIQKALAEDPDNPRIKSHVAAEPGLIPGIEPGAQDALAVAARMIEEAHETDPLDTFVLFNAARLATNIGKVELGVELNEYVADRDPLFFWAQLNLGSAYFEAGRLPEAITQFRVALGLNDREGGVQWKLGRALVLNGQAEEALAHFDRDPDPIYRLQGRAMAFHALGDDEQSQAAMAELLAFQFPDEYDIPPIPEFWPSGLARAYGYLGKADEAFQYLQAAHQKGRPLGGLAVNPQFVPIHDDPRWEPFLREVGQHPEQVAAFPFDINVPQ